MFSVRNFVLLLKIQRALVVRCASRNMHTRRRFLSVQSFGYRRVNAYAFAWRWREMVKEEARGALSNSIMNKQTGNERGSLPLSHCFLQHKCCIITTSAVQVAFKPQQTHFVHSQQPSFFSLSMRAHALVYKIRRRFYCR